MSGKTLENKLMRVIIADDHELIRRAMTVIFQKMPNIKIVGEAGNGEELFSLLKETPCDLLCLDVYMPSFNFFSAIPIYKKLNKKMKILVLTSMDDHFSIKKIIKEDIDAIVSKSEPAQVITDAINAVEAGKRFFSYVIQDIINSEYVQSLSPNKLIDVLTPQEKKVMSFVARGFKNKEIARELNVQEFTIDFHKKNIKTKMNVSSNAEITKIAIEHILL